MLTYAVIPTRDREDMLADCIWSLRDQVDKIILINTRLDGKSVWSIDPKIIEIWDTVPNISRWWNYGIDLAYEQSGFEREWNVLVVNDDIIAPPNLVQSLSTAMRQTTAVLASPNMSNGEYYFHGPDAPMQIDTRVTGYAFMLRGEADMRVDEDLEWWWSDTDLEMRARNNGGVVLVPGCRVVHRDPNGYTERDPYFNRQAGLDRETFIGKWGSAPW